MESMVDFRDFWRGKCVLVTGHSAFKGAWLVMRLKHLGAKVIGYSLNSCVTPINLFEVAEVEKECEASIEGNISDLNLLINTFQTYQPEIVFHLAAQSLVRTSYQDPITTYNTNVMGTLYLLEAIKEVKSVKSAVIVTSDKCYKNNEWIWGYRENEPLGGKDPYSSSKACAEILTASYRHSFGLPVATARAGNVIGGGDWAKDRLIPDIIRAFSGNEEVRIRNPNSIRPWQHVLEPLQGYLMLAKKLYHGEKTLYADAWNFGPHFDDARNVEWIVKKISQLTDNKLKWKIENHDSTIFPEAGMLKLDWSKAKTYLDWQPVWNLEKTLTYTIEWYQSFFENKAMKEICYQQIKSYENDLVYKKE